MSKTLTLLLIILVVWNYRTTAQPVDLLLTGNITGTHTALQTIELNPVCQLWPPAELRIGPCNDNFIPAIGVLLDSCITADEWDNDGYAILVDSAAFFSPEAMQLFNSWNIMARDDCGIDSFYVKSLEILPPGTGINLLDGYKEFRIKFRAVDYAGRIREEVMIWIRKN